MIMYVCLNMVLSGSDGHMDGIRIELPYLAIAMAAAAVKRWVALPDEDAMLQQWPDLLQKFEQMLHPVSGTGRCCTGARGGSLWWG